MQVKQEREFETTKTTWCHVGGSCEVSNRDRAPCRSISASLSRSLYIGKTPQLSFQPTKAGAWRVRCVSGYRVILWMLLIALLQIGVMAALSSTIYRVHPDEFDHIAAAKFYVDHWLPPPIGDPRTLDSYSYAGTSYLSEWDVVYFVAGKFAAALQPLVPNDVHVFRMFNVLLLCILIVMACFSEADMLVFSPLLLSPQLWYLFSYFNGDAFPIFIAFLAALELTSSSGRFNDRTLPTLRRFLLLGVYVGLLVLSKRTFWMYGMFAIGYVAIVETAHARRIDWPSMVRAMGALLLIIGCVSVPRVTYDIYVNGAPQEKAARLRATADALANPGWRTTDPPGSRHEWNKRRLRERGMSISAILWEMQWAKQTIMMSFGGYGYRSHFANGSYYWILPGCFLLFVLYVTRQSLASNLPANAAVLAWAWLCCLAIVGLSVYHSWANDFQPEGRYLFGIFAIFAVLVSRCRRWLAPLTVNALIGVCFALSLYSFVAVGLTSAYEERFSVHPNTPGMNLIRQGAPR